MISMISGLTIIYVDLRKYDLCDIIKKGDRMKYDKKLAMKLIQDKLDHKSFLQYKEIAQITGYHPKYILKLKKEIQEGTVSLTHGNRFRKPSNSLSEAEEKKIVDLYKKTHVSIRKFCKFYGSRSYSCIYQVLKRNGLLEEEK